MSLADLNAMSADQATHAFMQCCTSSTWVARMVEARPFADADALYTAANENWLDLAEGDYLEAFDGHPKIGDVSSLKAKYANTKELASGEQSSVNEASDEVIDALAAGNSEYEEKFGFIFIVCATGKSAVEMLALLNARLPNDREAELKNAAEEQRKIFHIRLNKLV
ncbi:2-oxo-4-hydroxy-4-carboxy-5-ureidoimidazoline decarboxylase [Pseudomaricurvus alkylphenolicus]|jgi:2-oxo-4-hydroxy-4-carboxy-5-ureidoimidazoline decarboxylase|uniref:2-oxo-4-hydroxy-4-carboxy-5-ureidoimidazoline decarboxylase n=1 Tax=Pseudomaricurvus alkylphenolicus TaxID=1306991 RepID=UPI0014207F54|nr:2-oxo-4-hydroxy-4-carboxy-5-ureidoimidazoline decarboxylase [Pseudomaricurvus alkylphenolicus]NIB40941.1 2-oxo-4-hydroxy-4-carboxy-5-ureidoimidazoline decarboxylase [Pseudomaricurvus alkylphenolicus]